MTLILRCPNCGDDNVYNRDGQWKLANMGSIGHYRYVSGTIIKFCPFCGHKLPKTDKEQVR